MPTAAITTCLLFDHGQAREAAEFYVSIFPESHMGSHLKAPADYPDGKQGDELTVEFTILGTNFVGLNGGPKIGFNPAVSFQIHTDTQPETDRYWDTIVNNGGTPMPCGWCRDRFGLSWQIVPRALLAAMSDPDHAAAKRTMQAMMTMTKIDIATIEQARAGALPEQFCRQSRQTPHPPGPTILTYLEERYTQPEPTRGRYPAPEPATVSRSNANDTTAIRPAILPKVIIVHSTPRSCPSRKPTRKS